MGSLSKRVSNHEKHWMYMPLSQNKRVFVNVNVLRNWSRMLLKAERTVHQTLQHALACSGTLIRRASFFLTELEMNGIIQLITGINRLINSINHLINAITRLIDGIAQLVT